MAPRHGRPSARHAAARPRARVRLGPSAKDLVIISRALTELAEFLEPRQQSAGRGRVVLDRRLVERRQTLQAARPDRPGDDRRQPPTGPPPAPNGAPRL